MRVSGAIRSDGTSGVSAGNLLHNVPPTPENQLHFEKAASERFAELQDRNRTYQFSRVPARLL